MKKIFLLIAIGCFSITIRVEAQKIKYSLHTIAKGETLSILAEKYHTTVGDIMRLNRMNAQSRLMIGNQIKIPAPGVTVPPVTPPTASKPADTSRTTTHIVQLGETLYAIAKKYKVKVDQLKQWNNINGNGIEPGQEIAVSAAGVSIVASKAITADTAKKEPVDTNSKATELAHADTSGQVTATSEYIETVPVNPTVITPAPDSVISNDKNDSYFAKDFQAISGKSTKEMSGDAMTFKTVSGWNDKKYYILTNDLPSGSIVRVTSSNGNSVYAKVLWKLEDMKLNNGLNFRISDAAASVLGITTTKFNLTIEYHE